MASKTWTTARRRDSEVIAALEHIAAAAGSSENWSLTIHVGQGQPVLVNGAWSTVKTTPDLAALISANEALAFQFSATFPNVSGASMQVVRAPEPFDTVTWNFQDGVSPSQYIPFLKSVTEQFLSFVNAVAIEKILGRELAEFYRAREASVLRLENVTQKLIEDTDQYRLTIDDRNDKLRDKLEKEAAELRDQLQQASDARSTALDTRSAELEAKEKTLDDRQSRHARRALRQDLQKELAGRSKSFSLTVGTSRKRYPIHALFLAGLILDAVYIGVKVFTAGPTLETWPTIVRLSVGAVGFAVILILYIRWSDQWFRQHADEEFRLKRMSLDVDRASWVVETAMEWQQQNGAPIPAQLLEELTQGLFASAASSTGIKHPVEDLAAALLGASSNMEVDLPGIGKATLGRKGVKELRSAMEASQPRA
jgi:hypothetical protein